jgi:D-alanine-D-alanine ligase-like ATP-grasp enzyme
VASDDLDYRENQSARVEPLDEVPGDVGEGLTRLMDRLGLDFGAADFKTCPDTGRLLFLEINTGPMFAAFDQASKGAVTAALADFLES